MHDYTGVDKIRETLRNWGTEFVLATMKKFSWHNCVLLPCAYILEWSRCNGRISIAHSLYVRAYVLYCLCECISDCGQWQSVWKNRKVGDLHDFERGQIIGARLAVASVTKTTTLLGVSRATISKVMSAYTNRGKSTSAKNSGRNSALTERDRRTLRRAVSAIA
jgi:hypothetical protein